VGRREKRLLDLWIILILIGNVLAFASVVTFGGLWYVLAVLVVIAVDIYWYYVRRVKGKKPRYPLVPPEGKGDAYLPRTNIPRPVYADFREVEEKRRKFAKLGKMLHKKKRKGH